jgi:preprotein translocase SecE subunit
LLLCPKRFDDQDPWQDRGSTVKIYKEGQGKTARNSVAGVIGLFAVVASMRLYEYFVDPTLKFEVGSSIWENWFAVSSWPIDYRFALVAPFLIAVLAFGVWQYNHPRWADFLIDTENELRNKVTWPSRKEHVSSSIVVVVASVLIGAFTFGADVLLSFLRGKIF